MNQSAARRGFTLIELLVVVSIIALLVAILLPSLKNAMVAAKDVVCAAHINQLGRAMFCYATEYKGHFSESRYTITGFYRGPVEDLQTSTIYPYASVPDLWVCPRMRDLAVDSDEIVRSYVTNWNCGPGNYNDSEQVAGLSDIRSPSRFALFGEENAWEHPSYGGWAINDGQLVADAWPAFHVGGSDTLATYHRPSADRYRTGNPWGYVPTNPGDVELNTGMSNVAFADGHVEFVDTLRTVMVMRNDPSKVKPSQRN